MSLARSILRFVIVSCYIESKLQAVAVHLIKTLVK